MSASNQRVALGALVAVVMFLVGGFVVLIAKGWIHPPDVTRASAVAPSVVPIASSAPVIVATTVAPPPPITGTTATSVVVTSAPIANTERTLAGLRPGFRACYNAGLVTDPKMRGGVVLAIKIDPAGNVQGADKVSGSGLSSAVENCIIERAKKATFEAPGGAGSTVQVPVAFVSSPSPPSAVTVTVSTATAKPFDPFGGRRE